MHKNWLKPAREATDLTQQQLAARIGATQSSVQKWEAGARKLTAAWAQRIAPVLKTTPEFLLFGNISIESKFTEVDDKLPIRTVAPVVGTCGAGGWMEVDELPGRVDAIPALPGRYSQIEQFAYKVFGNSMSAKGINDGEYVVCVKNEPVRHGDTVVIERRRGQLFQRSVKEYVPTTDRIEFWPRSHDPAYQTPISVPRDDRLAEDDDTEIVIIGRVIGHFGFL